MSNQPAAEALKEAEDKLSQCRHALRAMIQFYLAGNGRDDSELVLVASDGQHISVDRNFAASFSKYFEASSSSGMKEAAERTIRMDDIDSKVLRSIIVYLTVGPKGCDKFAIPLPKLRPMEALQLMSVSTRLLMPDVCSKIAHDIDEIADLDLEFYVSADDHIQTSGPEYQAAWSTASSKALKAISLNIEKFARDPLFSKLSIEVLQQVIKDVSDLPDCWMDQDDVSNGFRLKITETENSISASVYVTEDNPISLCLGGLNGGLYKNGVRLEKSGKTTREDFQKNGEKRYFGKGWSWPEFIEEKDLMQLRTCPPCRFSFYARMSILHRKCFALLSFVSATFEGEQNDCLRFSGRMLVKSLQYFHKIEGEPAQKCFAALLDYAAISFEYIKAEESLMAVDASIVCALIERDSLYIEDEETVLKFVAQWAMTQQAIITSQQELSCPQVQAKTSLSMDGLPEEKDATFSSVGSGSNGRGDRKQKPVHLSAHASDVTSSGGPLVGPNAELILELEKVLKLVRFPFIPFAKICSSGLTKSERTFLKAVPSFLYLATEAAKLQGSKGSNPGQPPNVQSLTSMMVPRTFYKDIQIPALDMSFVANALL